VLDRLAQSDWWADESGMALSPSLVEPDHATRILQVIQTSAEKAAAGMIRSADREPFGPAPG
jgi:hypothetical protein